MRTWDEHTRFVDKQQSQALLYHWILFLQRFATFLQPPPPPTFLQTPYKISLNPKP